MKKVLLCGHTGSVNHGCEAIIRSTIDLMRGNHLQCDLASFQKEQDEMFGLDKIVGNILEYQNYTKITLKRIYNSVARKYFGNHIPEEKFVQKNIFSNLSNYEAALVVGGDTYCYAGRPYHAYALNQFAKKKDIRTVLWSCSIGKENIDEEMNRDLFKYTKIYPRESITYQNLIDIGIPSEKLCLMSDSAFILSPESIVLPDGFTDVIAYNPSYTIHKVNNLVWNAREELIEQILSETSYKIALIPHVFSKGFGDARVCEELYDKYKGSGRVFLFDDNFNCCQLKYIISKCRFLIAERTHASIAGYSSNVPTFVLGYSVKSSGIALDIFGKTAGYVLAISELSDKNDYWKNVRTFMDNEEENKRILNTKMQEYCGLAEQAGIDLRGLIDNPT